MLQGTAFCSRRSWWSSLLMTSRRVAWSDAEPTHSRGSDAESEGLIALHRCVDLYVGILMGTDWRLELVSRLSRRLEWSRPKSRMSIMPSLGRDEAILGVATCSVPAAAAALFPAVDLGKQGNGGRGLKRIAEGLGFGGRGFKGLVGSEALG